MPDVSDYKLDQGGISQVRTGGVRSSSDRLRIIVTNLLFSAFLYTVYVHSGSYRGIGRQWHILIQISWFRCGEGFL